MDHSTTLLSAPGPNPGKPHSQSLFWTHTPDLATGIWQHQAERQKWGNDREKRSKPFPSWMRDILLHSHIQHCAPQCRSQCKQVFLSTWHEKAFPLPTSKLFPQFPSGCSERQESLEVPAGTPVDCYTQRHSSVWKSFCTVHQILV